MTQNWLIFFMGFYIGIALCLPVLWHLNMLPIISWYYVYAMLIIAGVVVAVIAALIGLYSWAMSGGM